MTDTTKGMEKDFLKETERLFKRNPVPVRELTGAKTPDSVPINPATDGAHGHCNHVPVDAYFLFRELF